MNENTLKFKVITSSVPTGFSTVEEEVNKFLKKNPNIKIHHATFTSGNSLEQSVGIFYEVRDD